MSVLGHCKWYSCLFVVRNFRLLYIHLQTDDDKENRSSGKKGRTAKEVGKEDKK